MPESKDSRVAVITGVGPGLGAALARRFARGYAVAINARSASYVASLASEIAAAGGRAVDAPADLGDPAQVDAAFRSIRDRLGAPEVLIYNAGSAHWGDLTEVTAEQYESDWRVNAFGAFLCAKQVVPNMIARGRGVVLFTGATAGVKAGARSASFGPAKFAMRGLAQSMARSLGPKGVHVAWINVDGVIETPSSGASVPQPHRDDLLKPEAIAETYWHLAQQDPSAWTMELEVRPFRERF